MGKQGKQNGVRPMTGREIKYVINPDCVYDENGSIDNEIEIYIDLLYSREEKLGDPKFQKDVTDEMNSQYQYIQELIEAQKKKEKIF